jgi:hypothetical protein
LEVVQTSLATVQAEVDDPGDERNARNCETNMIGVATNPEHRAAASEFFELFKTAWEFYRSGEEYDAVICCGIIPSDVRASLVLVYAANELSFDQQHQLQVLQQDHLRELPSYCGWRLPVYTGFALIIGNGKRNDAIARKAKYSLATEIKIGRQSFIRIGYDLFAEVRHLLFHGQPAHFAHIPVIEIHITILRGLLVEHQIPFEEVPPVPAGYNFIVCLTHDVDHFAIGNHKCDHTMFGFLYRASIGSIFELLRGKKSLRQVARNWLAVLSLPLVYLRILPDFWSNLERYLELDHASTFFIVPKKGEAGTTSSGARLARRAVRYNLSQLQTSVREILAHRGEIAVHGIDAWRGTAEARKEREQIQALTHSSEVGVRMHWLFFDSESAEKLDEAGFLYDSTVGYNETVGYRAGTTQAFRPFGTKRLLELPLHIMDTALFYPTHLNLSPKRAMMRVNDMVDDMRQFGGVLMVNWHDRSIAPERLWDDFYAELVGKFESAGAWFCTAAEATQWFRRRRVVTFGTTTSEAALASTRSEAGLPGLRIRSYHGKQRSQSCATKDRPIDPSFSEVLLDDAKEIARQSDYVAH